MTAAFVTDMNDRERQRFIEGLQLISSSAGSMIEALENGEDQQLLGPSLMFTMGVLAVQDLFKVLATATSVDTTDLDKPFGFGVTGAVTDGD